MEDKGIYSMLNKLVRQFKDDGKFIIERNELTSRIDVSDMDREELEERYKNAAACNVLWANEYRSYIKGRGIYLDFKTIKSRLIMDGLVSNVVSELQQKAEITRLIERLEKECVTDMAEDVEYAQMFFGEDEEGKPYFGTERTNSEIIALLKELQEKAEQAK